MDALRLLMKVRRWLLVGEILGLRVFMWENSENRGP